MKRAKAAKLNPDHLKWIRSLPCCVPNCRSYGGSQAHHVRNGTGGGMGMKPGPEWTIPICVGHHSDIHNFGNSTFELRHGLDLRSLAIKLASESKFLKKSSE